MADIEKINPTEIVSAELLGDLRKIIDSARSHVAATANYELTAMYWHIGDRINRDVLNNERAEYGQQIVSTLSTQLQQEYETKSFRTAIQRGSSAPITKILSSRQRIIHRPMTVKRLRRTAECPVDSQGVSAPREFAKQT